MASGPCGFCASRRFAAFDVEHQPLTRRTRFDAHTLKSRSSDHGPSKVKARGVRPRRVGLQLNAAGAARAWPCRVCTLRVSRAKRRGWPSIDRQSPMPGSSSSSRRSMRTPSCRPPSLKKPIGWPAHAGTAATRHPTCLAAPGVPPWSRRGVDPAGQVTLEKLSITPPPPKHARASSRDTLACLGAQRIAAVDGAAACRRHLGGQLLAPQLAQRAERQRRIGLAHLLPQRAQRIGHPRRRSGQLGPGVGGGRRGLAHRGVADGETARAGGSKRRERGNTRTPRHQPVAD